MKRAWRWLGTGLLFLVVALSLTAALLPRLLDARYYRGPVSDHFDGERFFNPGPSGEAERSVAQMARFFSGVGKAEWPGRVSVTPGKPAAQVGPTDMVATWIGHATVLVQAGGVNVLTDPIWSERASLVSWAGPKRVRAPGVRMADLPRIDLVVISHNHYDHLDLPTLQALWARDRPLIVTSLGNDTILRSVGVPAVALDWGGSVREGQRPNQTVQCASRDPGCNPRYAVTVERNHHWSSRWGADRNRALWSSFTIQTPAGTIYHAGDTGFGDGRWFEDAARRGPIRLAILPIGAYEPRDAMKGNHVNPAEAVRIFDALKPAMALGVHWGTFQLTFETIDAPPAELARVRGSRRFVTTEVGESVAVPER